MDQETTTALTPSRAAGALATASQVGEVDFQLEAFAHAIAFGVPMRLALTQAGYEKPSSSLGFLLLKDPRVVDIIEADRVWLREKLAASKESLAMQLDQDREFAYAEGNPSAAVSASIGKARVLGFMDVGSSNKAPSKITIEWGDTSQEIIHDKAELIPAEDLND